MAQAEIEAMVPPETIARIKETDPNPLFKIFSVGHEGTATANKVGFGKVAMQYFRDAIKKICEKVKPGLEVFSRHAATNEHAGRTRVGEVVSSTLKEIGDKLHSLAAIYIYPDHKDDPLDIASIETDIKYRREGENAVALDIEGVTGIALSSKDIDQPGFPGATLLGAFQAFSDKLTSKEAVTMTHEELQAAIKEGGFSPSDLFSKEVLTGDSTVGGIVRAAKQTEYEHAKQVEQRLGEKLTTAQGQIDALNKETLTSRSKGVLSSIVVDRKLNDQQKAFIERHSDSFTTESNDADGLKRDLVGFVDNQLKEFDETAKIFGVESEKQDEGDGSGGTGDKPAGGDLTNPDVNPLIPGGKAAAAAATQ